MPAQAAQLFRPYARSMRWQQNESLLDAGAGRTQWPIVQHFRHAFIRCFMEIWYAKCKFLSNISDGLHCVHGRRVCGNRKEREYEKFNYCSAKCSMFQACVCVWECVGHGYGSWARRNMYNIFTWLFFHRFPFPLRSSKFSSCVFTFIASCSSTKGRNCSLRLFFILHFGCEQQRARRRCGKDKRNYNVSPGHRMWSCVWWLRSGTAGQPILDRFWIVHFLPTNFGRKSTTRCTSIHLFHLVENIGLHLMVVFYHFRASYCSLSEIVRMERRPRAEPLHSCLCSSATLQLHTLAHTHTSQLIVLFQFCCALRSLPFFRVVFLSILPRALRLLFHRVVTGVH